MNVFQRKVGKKNEDCNLAAPRMEYMNIYSKPVKRLNCFQNITRGGLETEREFPGNAQVYEKQLERLLR